MAETRRRDRAAIATEGEVVSLVDEGVTLTIVMIQAVMITVTEDPQVVEITTGVMQVAVEVTAVAAPVAIIRQCPVADGDLRITLLN